MHIAAGIRVVLATLALLPSCSSAADVTDAPDAASTSSAANGPPTPCTSDADCPTVDVCFRGTGTCVPSCATFRPDVCPTGMYCDLNECVGAHGCNPPPPGTVCSMICWAICRPGIPGDD